jgi:hypothetical protein
MGRLPIGLCIVALGLLASLALARIPASSEAPLSVQHVEVSRLGRFLAHEVTEEISASRGLRVSEDGEDGWKLVLLTSDRDEITFYSAILIRKQFDDVFDQYVIAFQGTCAVVALQSCARDIVQRVQEPIAEFESSWEELSEPANEAENRGAAASVG